MTYTEQADRLTEQPDHPTQQAHPPTERSGQPGPQTESLADPAGQPGQQKDRLTVKSQWSNWTVLAMIILCFFVIVRFHPFDSRRCAGEGKRLPQLQLRPLTTDGEPVTLGHLTGRVVLMSFWGPWSEASRQELPHLAEIDKKFRGHPAFRLLSVSCGEPGKVDFRTLQEETEALLRQQGIDVPVYADPGRVTRSAVNEVIGFRHYPTTLVLDRQGRIRNVWIGYEPGLETKMQQLITRLLAEG
jgi:cytochrome c biogenesis protein CcmG/thiol:disulfide interchange protein DsbE